MTKHNSKRTPITLCVLLVLIIAAGIIGMFAFPSVAYAQSGTSISTFTGTTNYTHDYIFTILSQGEDYNESLYTNTGIQIYAPTSNGTSYSGNAIKLDSTMFTVDFTNARTVYPITGNSLSNYSDPEYHFEILNSSGNVAWFARFYGYTRSVTSGDTTTTYYKHTVNINGRSTTSAETTGVSNARLNLSLFGKPTVNLSQGNYTIRIRRSYKWSQRVTGALFAANYQSTSTMTGTLIVDTNAPTISLQGNSTGKSISSGSYVNERVKISVGDPHPYRLYYKTPTMTSYTYTSSTSYIPSTTQGWYYAFAEDSCGNRSETVSFYYDAVAPVGKISSNGTTIASGSYINGNFSYSATDSGSGVTDYYYKTPNSGTYQQYMPGMVVNKTSGDGWYYFYCKDKSGNLSPTLSVYLETAAPIVGIYRNGDLGYSKTVTSAGTYETNLYFNVGDTFRITCDTSSGKVSSNYTLNTNITITGSFPKDFDIRLTNATGVTSVFKVHVAKEKPKLVIDGTSYENGATLYFNADKTFSWTYDTGWNGGNVKIVSSGNKNIDETVYFASGTDSYAIATDNGTDTVYEIAVTDAAFNVSNYTVVIDKEVPNGTIQSNGKVLENGGYTNKPACVEFTETGVTAQYSINGGEYQPYLSGQTFTADATYIVLLSDRAGNKTSYTVTVDTVAPSGQLYADYSPVADGTITNGKIYFSWNGDITATVNGKPYVKNTVLSDDATYTFVLTDFAGNSTAYTITIDTVCPSYNADRLAGDKNYKISKWYVVTIERDDYSFASYDEALTFAADKEFASGVTVLNLESVEDFKQSHLVASNGDPDNLDDEVRTGEYWLYKSKANPNSLLYYFDRELLDEVIAFYAKDTVSNVNYYVLDGNNEYGTPSDSMYDNVLTAIDGTLAPVGNRFVFEKADSTEVYAELVGRDGTRFKVAFGTPFGQQFTVNGLYKITEIDAAKNETTYYLYLDMLAPELNVSATIFGNAEPTELTIDKDILAGIAAYYYERFDMKAIADADKWAVLTVTNGGNTAFYTYGDKLPSLNIGGEYLLTLYDRTGNSYSFTVYIVGSPADIGFNNNSDDTAFDLKITLEQNFDTLVSMEVRRNGVLLEGISTDTLAYTFDKGGVYTVTLRDNFGRVIEKEYTFVKSLPNGTLSGVENGGKTKTDVTFTFDSGKYFVVVTKDGKVMEFASGGELLFTANDMSSGEYVIRLINLTDEENYCEYAFVINTLAPAFALSVADGSTTNKDVTVSWEADDIVSVTYTVNGGEQIALENGQVLTAEGSYVVTATNDLGTTSTMTFTVDKTLDYYVTVGEQIASIDRTSETVAVFSNENLYVSVTKNGTPTDYAFGDILSDEAVYVFRISDDFGNAVTFTMTIDKSVSYSANVGSGLISSGEVSFANGEKLTVTVTKDKEVIDYAFGQILDDEGEYKVVLCDNYGNEKTVQFRIVKGVKRSLDYTLGENVEVLSVIRNGENIAFEGNRLHFTVDGEYTVTARADGEVYTFTLALDSTAPTVVLSGVENGGTADGIITITEPSEEVTIEVYFNGELIPCELGAELTEYGDYRIVVTDAVGNTSEYAFTLKHLLNGGAVALVVIGIFVLAGVVITIILLRKKGKFGKNKPMKKQSPDKTETESDEG